MFEQTTFRMHRARAHTHTLTHSHEHTSTESQEWRGTHECANAERSAFELGHTQHLNTSVMLLAGWWYQSIKVGALWI